MKKLLSIILACAMIMSLFCVVPASADVVYSSAKLPYFFSDFENDTALPGAATVVDSARGNVAKIATTANSPTDIEINSAGYGQGAHIAYDFVAGDQLTVSFWLKLSKPLTEGAAMRVIFWNDASGYSAVNIYIPDYTSTDWQYVKVFQSMGAFNATKANFRTGINENNKAADGSYEVDYYIDDFEMKVEHGTARTSWINTSTGSWTYYMEKNAAAAGRNVVEMEGPGGEPVKVRQWQGSASLSGHNQLYSSGGGGGQSTTMAVGDEVRVTAWIHSDKEFASTPYYVLVAGGVEYKAPLSTAAGWQRLDHTFTITASTGSSGSLLHNFGVTGRDSSTAVKATDETYPVISMFGYNINFKGAEKALPVAHTSYSHSGSGSVAYWGNGMEIQGSGGISTTQHDGTTGTVSEVKASGVADKFNQIYNANWAGAKFEHTAGDIISVSAWVKLPAVAAADIIYYTLFDLAESIVLPINGKSTDWQYIEGSMVASADHSNIYYHSYSTTGAGGYTDANTANWPKDEDGNCISIYVDDWSVSVGTPSEAAAVYPVATAQPATLTGAGITPVYSIVSKTGAAITDATVVLKVIGATSGKVYATSYAATAPAVTANETLVLEITPVGNGYVGAPVTASIIDLSAYNGVQITVADDSAATLSTDTALTNAKLIWVGYTDDTEHGCIEMTGVATANVTMDAYTEAEFAAVGDLGDYTFVKVFVWSDLDTAYAPLASYYEF